MRRPGYSVRRAWVLICSQVLTDIPARLSQVKQTGTSYSWMRFWVWSWRYLITGHLMWLVISWFRLQVKLVWRECSVESQALWCFTWEMTKMVLHRYSGHWRWVLFLYGFSVPLMSTGMKSCWKRATNFWSGEVILIWPAVCTLHRENVFWRLKSGDCPQSISQWALTDTEAGLIMLRTAAFWR